ncbi:MAG: trypsin-like peptidase domain-containing protein [Planctomycetota bacterium]
MKSTSTLPLETSHRPTSTRLFGAWLGAMITLVLASPALPDDVDPATSTIYIEAVTRQPQYTEPWRRSAPETSSGTGFVVEAAFDGPTARYILTANHVVQYADAITVYLPEPHGQHPARLVVASPEFDLALLELERGDQLQKIAPLPIAPVPPVVEQDIRVFGYPIGGADQSVTSGIVSRIETAWTDYDRLALRVQIDAALNPGNSGGPAVGHGRVLGLAYQVNDEAENIGYLVPSVEITRFLQDVADGAYDRPAHLQVFWQSVIHDAQRRALRVPDNQTGVWVRNVRELPAGHPHATQLRPNDVITAIGSANISNEGLAPLYPGITGRFEYLADRYAFQGKVPLTVYRNGQRLTVQEPAPNRPPRLVPWLMNEPPPYYIYGPIVFTRASRELYYLVGDGFRPILGLYGSPLMTRFVDWKEHDEHELVAVASAYFPHGSTRGLEDPTFNIIQSINGKPVKNLAELVRTLEASDDEFLEIVFADSYSDRAVFDRRVISTATESILDDNGIRHRASSGLRPLLKNP